MRSTMQNHPLVIADLFEHGERVHGGALVYDTRDGEYVERTFADIADEARRLAAALADLGLGAGDVVGTLCWNTSHHVSAYFAVPSSGLVLHTLNLRLHPSQLAYIARHAGDQAIIVDEDLVPLLMEFLPEAPSVRHVLVLGRVPTERVQGDVRFHAYDDLVSAAEPMHTWPAVDEDRAAVLCYTTGTTGDPKGIAYSHRSTYLHTLMISSGSVYGFSDSDRVMPVVPMFHANAWGWVHAAWIAGADLVMNGPLLQPPHLAATIDRLRPTMMAGVPTIWSQLSRYAHESGIDMTCFRVAVSGGSPLSEALAREIWETNGIVVTQGLGMTETSPLLTYSRPPAGTPESSQLRWATLSGRIAPGIRARVVNSEGAVQPWDGTSVGELELAGNTVTGSYLGTSDESRFHDGWLRSGDLAVVHPGGWIQLKDRIKDGIKSGGEWISTIELEAAIAEHPDVVDVAVVGAPDPKWEERPHAFVVMSNPAVGEDELKALLAGKVAKWWIPDRWTFTTEMPRTSVGKIDKKSLRRRAT